MNTVDPITSWLQQYAEQVEAPLILACRQGRLDVLEHLLTLAADLSVIDLYGNNALWAACFAESSACIQRLVAAGIDINYQNPSGATALIYASSSGKHKVVEQLLQLDANPLLTTQDDFSALDLAANRECLRLLKTATTPYKSQRSAISIEIQ